MKYINNLIPKDNRVDLSRYYLDINKTNLNNHNKLISAIGLILGFIAIGFLFSRLAIGLILLIAAISLHHESSSKIEEIFTFSFTSKVKKYLFGILFLFSIPLNIYYGNNEKVELALKKAKSEKESIAKKIVQEQELKELKKRQEEEKILIDKVEHLKNLGKAELSKRNYKKAINYFNQCIAVNIKFQDLVNCEKGLCFYSLAQYDSATVYFAECNADNAYIQLGKCYEKQNQKLLAIKYYKLDGTQEGEKLYNKLNPIKRRVLYYQTMCCDGTASPSNAKGRGACSHHGGVCDWNKPIYQEYREIEE